MKKFFILTVILILCVAFLVGCGAAASPDYVPYWGQMTADGKDYLEKSVFEISIKADDDGNPENEKFDKTTKGTYTTTLTRVSDGDGGVGSIYKLESAFEFSGKYNGKDFSDKYTSVVTFKVTSQSFTTLSSTKTVENATFLNDNASLSTVSYTLTNEYKDKKVTSKITVSKDTGNKLSEVKSSYTQNLKDYYFDNESLFLGIRALTPAEGFSLASYNLLEPLEQEILTMQAAYVSQADAKIELAAGTKINGVLTDKINCNKVETKISGTINTGASIFLYYSNDCMVRYINKNGVTIDEIPYYFLAKVEHGDMIYTLKEFDNQSKKV